MYPNSFRRLLSVALIAAVFAVPSYAKRRSVAHPSAANLITVEVSGIVLDSVTNQPVVGARVEAGESHRTTGADGRFTLRSTSGPSPVVVHASRTGYHSATQNLTTGGKHELTLHLAPRPTVLVRTLSNQTYNLDFDTIEFGYPVPFSGYRSADFEDFCNPQGQAITVNRNEIQRINGPATPIHYAACCPSADTLKVNVTLKNGITTDLYFIDACDGVMNIDILGRDHVTNKSQYIPFNQIAEVVFP